MIDFFWLLFGCLAAIVGYLTGWEARGVLQVKAYWRGHAAGRKSERAEFAREILAGASHRQHLRRALFLPQALRESPFPGSGRSTNPPGGNRR